MSWAADYIGIPWVPGESDCWAFARCVWSDRFGIEVPPVDVDALSRLQSARAFAGHDEYNNWQPVEAPADGDAVVMGKNRQASHIGIWCAESNAVVHSVQGAGVVCTRLAALKGMGLRVLAYYRRRPACTPNA